jgi:large repetitive protein
LNKIKYNAYYFCNTDSITTPTITGNKLGKFSADSNLAIDTTGKINFKQSKQGIYEITYTSKGTNNCILEAKTKINFTTGIINDSINKISYGSYFFTDTTAAKPIITGAKNGKFASESLFIKANGEIIFKDTTSKFGVHTIYYSTISSDKCNLQTSTRINYIDTNKYKPTISFSYPTENCGNTKTLSPTFAKDFVIGGTFTANNGLIINSATGEIDLVKSKLDSSNYLIKYVVKLKYGTKQKEFKDSIQIRIYNPTVKMSYAKVFYNQTDSITPIFSGDRSGKYSAESGLIIHPSTGIINLKTVKQETMSLNIP